MAERRRRSSSTGMVIYTLLFAKVLENTGELVSKGTL
jgi:hypothetical protein